MKVVLLAGGLGTRMREETEYKAKPMVEVGGVFSATFEQLGPVFDQQLD